MAFENIKADLGRLRRYGSHGSTLRLILENQGLWAVICYRAGKWLNTHRPPPGLRHLIMAFYHAWWKSVEMSTGISISPDCTIGPGLYIGHFGGIVLHTDVVMGRDCNLSQGVTLGLGRKGEAWGVPTCGDRVYIAPGAKVVGPIHLADGTVVGANAVVTRSTEPDDVVAGVPARVIGRQGSGEYIS
ncbi:serine acetyltransferase [bacterium]|nr:serine acetyltransferase [bacterium]